MIFPYVFMFLCLIIRWADCASCTTGCLSCTNAESCTTCMDGFYSHPSSTICLPCEQGCADCTYSNGYVCNTCQADHQKNGNICFKCSSNCKTCSSKPYNCDSCKEGQELESVTDDGETYQKCVDDSCKVKNCAACKTGINDICETPMKGYFVLIQNAFECGNSAIECNYDVDPNHNNIVIPFVDDLKTQSGFDQSTYVRIQLAYPDGFDFLVDDLTLINDEDKAILNYLYLIYMAR